MRTFVNMLDALRKWLHYDRLDSVVTHGYSEVRTQTGRFRVVVNNRSEQIQASPELRHRTQESQEKRTRK